MANSTGDAAGPENRTGHLFCPYCGTEDTADGGFCNHCGEGIAAPSVDRHRPEELATCSNCSTTTLVQARRCVGCGVSLEDVKPLPYERVNPDDSLSNAAYGPPPDRSESRSAPAETASRWPFSDAGPSSDAAVKRGRATRVRPELKEEPNDSGSPDAALPEELRGFNWGAFLLGPAWGIGNGIWLAGILLVLFFMPASMRGALPLIYLPAALILGFKGNELAWRAKKWLSTEHFRRVQRTWMMWGFAVGMPVLLTLMFFVRAAEPAE